MYPRSMFGARKPLSRKVPRSNSWDLAMSQARVEGHTDFTRGSPGWKRTLDIQIENFNKQLEANQKKYGKAKQ